MSLIISAYQRFEPVARQSTNESGRKERIDELLSIMLPWDPRERSGAFKMWLRGSLSLTHLHVLTTLETSGALPMSHLADALDVSVASATGIVSRMEERGLVERRHSDTDRRVVLVHLTPAGTAVFVALDDQRRAHMSKVLGRLTASELDHLLIGFRATRTARAAIAAEAEQAAEADQVAVTAHAEAAQTARVAETTTPPTGADA